MKWEDIKDSSPSTFKRLVGVTITLFELMVAFGISEAQCWRIITTLEHLLIKSNLFHIKGKKKLLDDNNFEVVLIDVTEIPIERPKKSKKSTIKTQVLVAPSSREIIAVL